MSELLSKATPTLANHAVQIALALIRRVTARAALRRYEREQADACVVMGV